MKNLDLANLLPRFFSEHLVQQRNVSPQTVAAYRDTFRLFLRFIHNTCRQKPSQLSLHSFTAPVVLDFLTHLEQKRGNAISSRNARLAAIRSFLHYASDLLGPELPELTRRIMAIPLKRHTRPMLGFLTREEIEAILATTDASWTGRRDQLLFQLLYNTGARVSEIIAVRVHDVVAGDCRQIQLHGKGRKDRVVPLWPQTQKQLRRWIKENEMKPDAPLLPNRYGQSLTRSGVAWQLKRRLRQAVSRATTLAGRRISAHTFRHTTAMHLLQAGIAPEIIALWLGHESPVTTHFYVEADLDMKRRTLEKLTPAKVKHKTFEPTDHLLRFLDQL
jgi:site-specific recombinase XerD